MKNLIIFVVIAASAVAGVSSAAKEKHESGIKIKDLAVSAGVTAAVYAGIYLPFLAK